MRLRRIEQILRQIEQLRADRDCSLEERLRLLLRRREMRRQLDRVRVRGSVDAPLDEVNAIYATEVDGDRIKENAKRVRLSHLWCGIERRRRREALGRKRLRK